MWKFEAEAEEGWGRAGIYALLINCRLLMIVAPIFDKEIDWIKL